MQRQTTKSIAKRKIGKRSAAKRTAKSDTVIPAKHLSEIRKAAFSEAADLVDALDIGKSLSTPDELRIRERLHKAAEHLRKSFKS